MASSLYTRPQTVTSRLPAYPRERLSWLGIGFCFAAPWLLLWLSLAELEGWPSNDDPFYAKPIEFWLEDGRLQAVRQYGCLTASSLAHIALGSLACVGGEFRYRNLYLVCIAQQALGCAAIYGLGRRLGLPRNISAVAAGSLLTYPLYFGHAFTFMTDGPATAWAAVAAVCLSIGWAERSTGWLLLGSLAISWGYWIRQTNGLLFLAPLVAWSICWLARTASSPSWRQLSLTASLVLILCGLAESGWCMPSSVTRISDVAADTTEGYWKRVGIAGYGWILMTGWFGIAIGPWLLINSWRTAHLVSFKARATCGLLSLLVLSSGLVVLISSSGRAHITNATGTFIQNGHFGPIFLSDMDEPGQWGRLAGVTWPALVWQSLTLLSIVSAAVLAWWSAHTLWTCLDGLIHERAQPLIIAATGWLVMILIAGLAITLFIEPHMDRYWLFMMPVVLCWCLLLAAHHGWQLGAGALSWAVLWMAVQLAGSAVFTHDMLAWNNARWHYVQSHLSAGNSVDSIDAGRDVNAWLRMDEDANTLARAGDESRWWSGRANICIANHLRPGWRLHTQLPWTSWATGQSHSLNVLIREPAD